MGWRHQRHICLSPAQIVDGLYKASDDAGLHLRSNALRCLEMGNCGFWFLVSDPIFRLWFPRLLMVLPFYPYNFLLYLSPIWEGNSEKLQVVLKLLLFLNTKGVGNDPPFFRATKPPPDLLLDMHVPKAFESELRSLSFGFWSWKFPSVCRMSNLPELQLLTRSTVKFDWNDDL